VEFGPWNPGLEAQVPEELRHLSTLFRPEYVFTSLERARDLRDLTGLDLRELVAFRPGRLALHELLIRVSADFSVPDGSRIEDLGINFRAITREILARHIEPRLGAITALYDARRKELAEFVDAQLAELFAAASESEAGSELASLWNAKGHAESDPLKRSAYRALAKVAFAQLVRHGRLWGGRSLLGSLATDIACNDFGAAEIGRLVEPWIATAAAEEGYRLLPRQGEPVVMNTKGASASGKSTLRPLQKGLAGDIGVDWSEFALISPDIWRKQLLDYASLGTAYKYGGALTGDELRVIDQKLDDYMARKAERGEMSHLLIDRFRFDSFAPDSDEAGSNLLTRFGHFIYLFFMITPPASLVERAWNRGLEVGRYKAVDDTLAHGVEAYSGMPQLFFTWVQRADKRVHFEFLDNSVPQGERPRTVAFGWNETLNVLDVKCMLDVERYRRVNIDAAAPEFLYKDPGLLAPERNTDFLRQCVAKFREVHFADQASGRIYLRVVSGVPAWADREALALATSDPDTRAGLAATAPAGFDRALPSPPRPSYLDELFGAAQTLGRWASERRAAASRVTPPIGKEP
jgi:hypothetical protein